MKVLILTAGVGSKLGDLTKHMNKAMIKIGKKPVISYIIEQYPIGTEYYIELGYKGDHIKEFLNIAYPDRDITYINVDNYDGEGSSQLYSIKQAEKYLQHPFIMNDCDSICNDMMRIDHIDEDFICGYDTSKLNGHIEYNTYNTDRDDNVTMMYDKASIFNPMHTYIGICGIRHFEFFWKCVDDAIKNQTHLKSDFDLLGAYYKNLKHFNVNDWTDTGTIDSIMNARKKFNDSLDILYKNNQSIFIIDDKVIKYFTDDGMTDRLAKRAEALDGFVPKVLDVTKHFFSYEYVKGENSLQYMNQATFNDMLTYLYTNQLWNEFYVGNDVNKLNQFKESCHKFYVEKTLKRVNEFKEKYHITEDESIIVNGIIIPKEYTIEHMLELMMQTKEYQSIKPTTWHGDFTLENIIYSKPNNYTLIDYRDSFGDFTLWGDYNYDFAKMNHNLEFNFDSAINHKYKFSKVNDEVTYYMEGNIEVYKCKEILKEFVSQLYDINFDYIELLTGLIWVNMSPLHQMGDLPLLLFYMGKFRMYEALYDLGIIKENKEE